MKKQKTFEKKQTGRLFGRKNLKYWIAGFLLLLDTAGLVYCGLEVKAAHGKLDQLLTQFSYMSDTNTVLVAEIGEMKSDIEDTLEEQASLLSDWEVTLSDMDFGKGTYTVSISLVPKVYTEETEAWVYFGTVGYPLTLTGYHFTGKAELTLDEYYDGNVTVLLREGSSRSTEVLKDYSDVQTDLSTVLSGGLYNAPVYENGILEIEETGYVQLHTNDYFTFDRLELLIEGDGEVIAGYDLGAKSNGENLTFEEDTEHGGETHDLSELDGLTYSFTLSDSLETALHEKLRIYLRAESKEGYVFLCDLMNASVMDAGAAGEAEEAEEANAEEAEEADAEENGRETDTENAARISGSIDTEHIDWNNYRIVYDAHGGSYVIP